jgi:shikimate kinase
MAAMQQSVALIGLSGAGKSTIGRLLAAQLTLPYVDTDALIVGKTGQTISVFFQEIGEAAFRALESETLHAALTNTPCVLATGGGIVLNAANRTLLRENAYCVWLDAPDVVLVRRLLAHDEARPLLQGDPLVRLAALRKAREALYAEVADLRIDTSNMSAQEIVQNISKIRTNVL